MRAVSPTKAVVRLVSNDTAGITLDKSELIATEGGNATYTVALNSEPTSSVTREGPR